MCCHVKVLVVYSEAQIFSVNAEWSKRCVIEFLIASTMAEGMRERKIIRTTQQLLQLKQHKQTPTQLKRLKIQILYQSGVTREQLVKEHKFTKELVDRWVDRLE